MNNFEREMLKGVTEAKVLQDVKKVIAGTGLKVQRINTGCFVIGNGRNKRYIQTAEAGTLDFEGYDKHGRFVGIECKRPVGGKLSPAQAARITDINAKGGVAFVVTSGAEAFMLLQEKDCI